MPYVITDACTKDFLCADSCSTAAIHPTQDEADAGTVSQLFIDPDACIDCGSCAAECPSGAIFTSDELPADKAHFADLNAAHFA
ncbi:MAG TPA: ferredoxin family protein [Acidobacteriaceae bacterium]